MEGTIKKWGNSLAWRIPKDIANELGLTEGKKVDISLKENQIIIKAKENFTIEDFMVGLTEKTKHEEIDSGFIGKEQFWKNEK